MATHDYDLANAAGLAFRSDLNNVLAAIISQNSSLTEPTTTVAYMFWADTTTAILKQRNAGNTAWNSLFNLTTGQWLGSATTSLNTTNTNGQIPFPSTQNPSADPNTLDDYEEGSFTGTLNGCTTSPTISIKYVKIGNKITLHPDPTASLSGTSNSLIKWITGLPASLKPGTTSYFFCLCSDNGGTRIMSFGYIDSASGALFFIPSSTVGSTWTTSGTATIVPTTFTYVL